MVIFTRMVVTNYLGPTDHRDARVSAKNVNTGFRRVILWDDDLSSVENHERAARLVMSDDEGEYTGPLAASGTSDSGYTFARLDKSLLRIATKESRS